MTENWKDKFLQHFFTVIIAANVGIVIGVFMYLVGKLF
jgi:hypothetical protein